MNWLCWHVGTVTDPKFGRIADACKTARVNVIGVWAVILEKAKEGRGLYSLDADDAGYALGIAPGLVEQIHAELQAKGLVNCGEVVNWEKRQHGGSAKRMAAKRARDAATPPAAQSDDVTESDVTLRHVTPTDRQTLQTDRQTKKDIDGKSLVREARASRLPENWTPEPEPEISEAVAARERPRFADYWRACPGAKGRKLDWQATWRNWCRKSMETPNANAARSNRFDASSPQAQRQRRAEIAEGLGLGVPGGGGADHRGSGEDAA
jgi:hypothetical protein